MALQSKQFLVIQVTEESEKSYTNLGHCSKRDFEELLGNLPSPGSFMAVLNGKMVVTVKKDLSVTQGQLALTTEHMEFAEVSVGEIVSLEVFRPPSTGFNLAKLTLYVELEDSSFTPTKEITAYEFRSKLIKKFKGQVFTEYQGVGLKIKDVVYKCMVAEVSLVRPGETTSSMAPKQGILCGTTSVLVDVWYPHLGKHISGAHVYERVFSEDLTVDNLETKLESLGIAGMTSKMMAIIHYAFLSRMTAPICPKRLKTKYVKGMLLYGPPGTGKTLVARAICDILNVKELQVVNGPEVLRSYVGASEETVRNLFRNAIYDEKTHGMRSGLHVIIFDEIDAIAKRRGQDTTNKTGDNIVNQLLAMIDGMLPLNNIFVIGTTNRMELIDEALLRHGRLELHVDLNYPDEAARLKILETCSKNYKKDKDVDFKEIARRTDGVSSALVSSIPVIAYNHALEKLKGKNFYVDPWESMRMMLTMGDLMKGLEIAMLETSTKRVEPSSTTSGGPAKTEGVPKEYEEMKDKIKRFEIEQEEMKKELSSVNNKLVKALEIKEKMKEELSSVKEHNNKIVKAVEELGAVVNNLKTEVECLSGLCERIDQSSKGCGEMSGTQSS